MYTYMYITKERKSLSEVYTEINSGPALAGGGEKGEAPPDLFWARENLT